MKVLASVFQLTDGSAETALVDLPDSVRERAPMGPWPRDRRLVAVRLPPSPQSAAARQRAPDHLLPDAGLPLRLLRAAS